MPAEGPIWMAAGGLCAGSWYLFPQLHRGLVACKLSATPPLSQVEALGAMVASKNSDGCLFSGEAAPWASEAEEGMQFHSYEAHNSRIKECSCHMHTQHQG